MKKSYVILMYIAIILLGSIGVSFIVWQDIKGKTIDQKYQENYNEYKEKLLNYEGEYALISDDIDIELNVYESNESYLVSTTFSNPKRHFKDLIILVIDNSELAEETEKIYPSLGIVGNFNNEFVLDAPNKKTTHSRLVMNYENIEVSNGVLIYLEYKDNNKTCISYLNVSAKN